MARSAADPLHFSSSSRVVYEIPTSGISVRGVTSLDDQLYLLLLRNDSQVAVYSANNYTLPRYLNVPGYKPTDSSDIAACIQHKSLYMTDSANRCVQLYQLANDVRRKWPVRGSPHGLAVTPTGNVLVACQETNRLVELSGESGEQVREMASQENLRALRHCVQLTGGQVVVCQGGANYNRVCLLADDGTVARSYGGEKGSGEGQLNQARHLAVDEDSQLIFVADRDNDRVVVLSPTLQFVRYIGAGMARPHRLHFDRKKRCLYVVQYKGGVLVIQFV